MTDYLVAIGVIFGVNLLSPLGVALQVLMLAAIVLLLRIDWAKWLNGRHMKAEST
jgi:membrane protein implicated in regulation of membrane protease activity